LTGVTVVDTDFDGADLVSAKLVAQLASTRQKISTRRKIATV
jgi:hypothetical protein